MKNEDIGMWVGCVEGEISPVTETHLFMQYSFAVQKTEINTLNCNVVHLAAMLSVQKVPGTRFSVECIICPEKFL